MKNKLFAVKNKEENAKTGCLGFNFMLQYYVKSGKNFAPIEKGRCMCPQQSGKSDYIKGCKNYTN